MAAPRKQKLKVFQAQIGFYDTVVAAPSRQAALRAWGVHQNLFAGGQAAVATDKDAVAAAVAHPEVVLKRPAGSSGPFQIDPRALPKVPAAQPKRNEAQTAKPAKPKPPPPRADRTALTKAEAALRALDARREAEVKTLRARQEALDAEKHAAQVGHDLEHRAAAAALAKARAAFRKAGGSG
jgi:hypothetical protein